MTTKEKIKVMQHFDKYNRTGVAFNPVTEKFSFDDNYLEDNNG